MPSAIRLIPLDNAIKHHDHGFHQIVIGLSGHAEFEIEGLGGSIATLSGCIVPANHVHYYEGVGENRQLILDLPIDGPSLTGAHHELSRLFDAPRFFNLDEPLRLYLDFLTQELGQPHHQQGALQRSGQGDLLAATFLGCLHARLHPDLTPAGSRRINLQALDRFIQRNLAERLTVSDLADQACLSEAHFSECFRTQTGLSPYQYLLRQRLGAARHLLTATRLSLTEIAVHTGFANQSSLSHAFRRLYGHPPSQLRRQALKNVSLTGSPSRSAPRHLVKY